MERYGELAPSPISSPLPYQLRLALRVRDKRHLRYIKHRLDPQEQHALLDHLICQQEDRLRDREPQSLGGLAVADQLEGGGLPDGQIRRIRALRMRSTCVAACRYTSSAFGP